MQILIALTIHTERLHDDRVWCQVKQFLEVCKRYNVSATWFSVNPTFIGYQAMNFNEQKWKKRLSIIAEYGHIIEQHTHFYHGKTGTPKGEGYDLSPAHIRIRLQEDRNWLEEQGYIPQGFVSGAWYVSNDLFLALKEQKFIYDLSAHIFPISYHNYETTLKLTKPELHNGIWVIPTTSTLRKIFLPWQRPKNFVVNNHTITIVAFHDYDLLNFIPFTFLRYFIQLKRKKEHFTTPLKIVEKLRLIHS